MDLGLLKTQLPPPGPLPRLEEEQGVLIETPQPSQPELVRGFEGINDTGSFPPDPAIAAGTDHVIQAVNRSFRISTKTGTTLSTTTFASWWSPVISGVSPFDPWVHYDPHDNRWVLLTVARNTSTNQAWYLIATSWTDDPTGSWCVWALDADVDGSNPSSNWADYPKIGLDDTNFYITSNQFAFSDDSFQYAKVRILGKDQFYNNTCGSIAWYDYWDLRNGDDSNAFTVQPALTFGTPGKEYLVNSRSGSGSSVTLWSVTGTWPNASDTPPSLTREATVSVGSYSAPPDAEQPGSTTRINTGDARLLNAVYRSGSLYTTHTIMCNSTDACARYLRISTSSNTATLDVAYGAPGFYYFYPAVMPNSSGHIFTVFNRSSASEFAGIRYTWRQTSDPAFQSSASLKAGEATYVRLDSLGRNRWGDYNGIALDPIAPTQVWIYSEYADSPANTWGTRVGLLGEIVCTLSTALRGTPDRKATLQTLYRFRDEVMMQSPQGQRYVGLFYRHALEGSLLVLRYPELRAQVREVVAWLLPTLEAAVDGRPAVLSAADVADIEDLLDAFAAKASPRLRRTIRQVRSDLRLGKLLPLFGINGEVSR
jgi:hypothetical protein